jgi:hypothetical protein
MYENAAANRCVWKELLHVKGIITNGRTRGPVPAFADAAQVAQFLRVAKRLNLAPANSRVLPAEVRG